MATAAVVLGLVNLPAQETGLRGRNPDDEWRALQAMVTATPPAATTVRTPAVVRAEQAAQALTARQLAQRAREFRTAFPEHREASEARKLEVLASLRGVMDNDTGHETQAREAATAYRADVRNTLADRVEVAVLAERTAARARFGGAVYANNGPELEAMADRLRREFGDVQEVFDVYLMVGRSGEMNTGRSIARKLQASSANAATKREAQLILDRYAILGRAPNVPLRLLDGSDARLTQPGGTATLLFYWPVSGPKLSARLMRAVPRNVRILHVMPGASTAQLEAARRQSRVPGTFCLDASPPGSMGGDLHVRHVPWVFGLDRSGALMGFGPISAAESVFNSIVR